MKIGERQHRGHPRLRRAVAARRPLRRGLRHRVQAQVQGHDVLRRRGVRPLQRPRAQARQRQVVDRPVAVLDRRARSTRRSAPTGRPPRCPPVDPLPPLVAALKEPRQLERRPRRGVHARHLPPARRRCSCIRWRGSACARRSSRSRSGSPASAAAVLASARATTSRRRPSAGARSTRGRRSTSRSRPRSSSNLSDDEKLARPSFEAMPAGVRFAAAGVTFGPAVGLAAGATTTRSSAPPAGHR